MITVKEAHYLTTQDLAELFERSPATVRYWIHERRLDRYGRRFGRDWVFTPQEVLRFIEEEMASWYAPPQWASQRRHLKRVQAQLHDLCGNGQRRKAERKRGLPFQSYALGSLRGSLRRVDLYRERQLES